jgi:hypothetical protein
MTTAGAAADSSQGLQLSGGPLQQHSMQQAADTTAAAHAAALALYMQQQHGYEVPLAYDQQLQMAHMQWAMSAYGTPAAEAAMFTNAGSQQQVGLSPALLQQLQQQHQMLLMLGQQQGQQLQQQTPSMAGAAAWGGAAGATGGAMSAQWPAHMQGVPDSDEAEDTTVMCSSLEQEQQQQSAALQEPGALDWAGRQRSTRKRSCSSVYKTRPQPSTEPEHLMDKNPYKRVYRPGKRAA